MFLLLHFYSYPSINLQDELLKLLLDLPLQTTDERLYLLAGKILLYFAENREVEFLCRVFKRIHTSFYPFNCIVKRSFSFDLTLFVFTFSLVKRC